MASRIVGAALAVGVVGGMITACLTVVLGSRDHSPAVEALVIGVPLVVMGMIGWRLAEVTDQGPPPSHRVLVQVTVLSLVLVAVVQVASRADGLGLGLDDVGALLLVLLYGGFFGLIPAAVSAVVLVAAVLSLRAARVPISLRAAQAWLTGVAVVVTVGFALWVGNEMQAGVVAGPAAVVAGTGALLTARWCLVDRRA